MTIVSLFSKDEAEAMREEALASGKLHALEKENRLLRACIEKQQAQLVAMDASLDTGAMAVVRELAKTVEEIGRLMEPWRDVTGRPRGPVSVPGATIDGLSALARDWKQHIEHAELATVCSEPGCILKTPLHRYQHHLHTDGFRQWTTHANGRRYKRGSW